ncbi:tRNA-modifying protein YgfZ [Saliniradius amylolyticus]|uniref:tRNA-modifying protein YgfZ n=1 Tax=Saliniradius amylolyticus TaxID=2183582 RepID=A0A2S2E4A2_9ALTE|nr:tRNA-modifying protein YgfZ [Saliniradius amylolyticus]AWL12463.1 tRNA-modifying protein YgfZ [Saliniradius amylolyticus]
MTQSLPSTLTELPENLLCPLPQLGLIFLQGEEQIQYLQGQITNDANQMSHDTALLAAHCDFKGKSWSLFHGFLWQDQSVLVGHRGGLAASLPELKKYGVFSKVDIRDTSDQFRLYGGHGQELEQWLQLQFGSLPEKHLEVSASEHGAIIRFDQPRPRYLLMLTPQLADTLETALADSVADSALWQALDIQAGLPQVTDATSNEFVPQMMNVHALDGINFKKGCYMGQEVVARTKFLGRNKRAAFILKGEGRHELNPGDTLELQLGENWRRGGTVLSCAPLTAETWLLAVLAKDTESDAVLRSKANPEQQFSVQPLPYKLDDQ